MLFIDQHKDTLLRLGFTQDSPDVGGDYTKELPFGEDVYFFVEASGACGLIRRWSEDEAEYFNYCYIRDLHDAADLELLHTALINPSGYDH